MCINFLRKTRFVLAISAIVFITVAPLYVVAQNSNLTPEQLAQLQALSQAERAAFLQNQGTTVIPQQPLATPVAIEPRAVSNTGQQDAIEANAQATQGTESLTEEVELQITPEPLRQFGYELFAGIPSTFAPANNIPVPLNYVIGPNDTVILQLYGQRNARYEIVISREGNLEFPEIGPLNVTGLTFGEMRELIEITVATSLIGQQISITMGALRSIQIFVLGEAFRPGSYTISSLSTMTNALFSSGGVTQVGSLRDIRLMRQGELITSLDLYDLLLRGDTSSDVRLQPNDVIFIPPIGVTVGIAGEVRRPAIFELKDEETVAEVLPLGGGLLATAFPSISRLERINDAGERTLVDIDLTAESDLEITVRDGDVLQIYSILDQVEGVVMLEGHVNRPGGFAWREGLRVTDILPRVSNMLPIPDLEYALISREIQPERTLEILNVNLRAALNNPGSTDDLLLQSRDRLLVFGARTSRQQQVQELVQTLRNQATFEELPLVVSIEGNILFAGDYPLISGMTADDLVRFAGGLGFNAELEYGLLQRQINLLGEIEASAIQFDPQTLTTLNPVQLLPQDKIIIFNANESRSALLDSTLSQLRQQADTNNPTQIVSVIGNVRFPGSYPLEQGLSVDNLIDIAGGLIESADTRQAELTRYDAEPSVGREVGHITINLENQSNTGRSFNLQPYDQLIVRQMPNWTDVETIVIGGEVNSPGTYIISQNEALTNVIRRAGGLTQFADPRAAVFLRESLRETETRLLAEFRIQLEQDIITLRLQQSVVQAGFNQTGGGGQTEAIQLLDRIRSVTPTGRLIIDLPTMLVDPNSNEVILRDGDRLLIPRFQQEITVSGEVFRPTSHLFDDGLRYSDYIAKSGNFTNNADKDNVYVVRSSGEIVRISNGLWFYQSRKEVEPGDNIIVPFNAYKPYGFFVWASIAQIAADLSTTLLLIDRIVDDP